MGLGHVPQEPFRREGEDPHLQGRERRRTAARRTERPRSSVSEPVASRRGANNARGRWGEERAARWYRERGFRIVERNWRHGRHGEIDLIARRDDVLVVCEVKTRATDYFGHPAQAVDHGKQARLRRLAAAWLAENRPGRVSVRFDVAAVSGVRVDVIENAF